MSPKENREDVQVLAPGAGCTPRVILILGCVALYLAAGVGLAAQEKPQEPEPAKKETDIAVDPMPRVHYGYGPNRRFGIWVPQEGRDIKKLTHSRDGNNNFSLLKVDGTIRELGGDAGKWIRAEPAPRFSPGDDKFHSVGIWVWGKTQVTQILDIVPSRQPAEVSPGQYKRLLDTCLILYVLENQDAKPHRVALRLELDTHIGKNDGVPFTIPGLPGLVTTFRDFTKPELVPDFIQALEVPNLKNPGTVAHMTFRVGKDVEPPSRVSLTRYSEHFAGWDVPVRNMKDDSVVVLYWPEKPLQAGEKRILGFAYGLGRLISNEGKLGLTVAGTFEVGELFTVVATVHNPQPKQTLKLILPKGLERAQGKETETVPPAGANQTSLVTWRVRSKQIGNYPVEVKSNSGLSASQNVAITEFAPSFNPVLISPGKNLNPVPKKK